MINSKDANITDDSYIEIAGWVHEIRDLGGIRFLLVRTRDDIVQVTFSKRKVPGELIEKVKTISRESVIHVKGRISKDERAPNGFEVIPNIVDILSVAESPLPLDPTDKVVAELDTRLDNRFLDMRRPKVKSIFMIRGLVVRAIRDFLYGKNFVEVTTPKIVATATEGGTALFPISYFDREAFLNQSPQLYKQILMSSGFERVLEIGPIFRAEEHSTRKHLNEATSIDVEVSYVDDSEVMNLLEELIIYIYEYINVNADKYLKTIGIDLKIPTRPFRQISYEEAIEIVDLKWGDDFGSLEEKKLGNEIGEHYFIKEWPLKLKPYYTMPLEKKGKTEILSKSFDLMHPRVELASGSQRINDYALLKKQMESRGLNPDNFSFYLDAFRYGMPPHAGWGLGLDRLVMTMLDLDNVREAVMFPRDRRRLIP